MIKISVGKNEIRIDGHALYDEYGKDIVCASVSSIIITSINACLKISKDSILYNDSNPLVINILSNDEVILKIIDNMIDMLKELASDYPKNIKFL